jgi:hypothetical protein
MLNCILDMVGKTKRAMALLQTKTIQFHRQSDSYEGEIKRKQADLITTTIKHAEDRVNEIKKKADEAVNDMRKQASNELQKAVMAAEYKANEIIKRERDHFDMVMHETHKKVKEEMANKSIIQQCDNLDEVEKIDLLIISSTSFNQVTQNKLQEALFFWVERGGLSSTELRVLARVFPFRVLSIDRVFLNFSVFFSYIVFDQKVSSIFIKKQKNRKVSEISYFYSSP